MDPDLDVGTQPVPPGFWTTLLGGVLAVFAPLAGFLGGSSSGALARSDAQGTWLVVGLVVGGLGVLLAFLGAQRWWVAAHR